MASHYDDDIICLDDSNDDNTPKMQMDVITQSSESETWWPTIGTVYSVFENPLNGSQFISNSSPYTPSAVGDHELICLDDSDDDGSPSSLLLDSGKAKKMTNQDIRTVFARQRSQDGKSSSKSDMKNGTLQVVNEEDSDCRICSDSDDDRDENYPQQFKNVSKAVERKGSLSSPEKISSSSGLGRSLKSYAFNNEIKDEKMMEKWDSQDGPSNDIAKPVPKEKEVSKKHIRKLEKCLLECGKQIKKLDEAEVNWDDEDDSTYVLTSKYKEKYMKIYQKLAQINKTSRDIGRKTDTKFHFSHSKYPSVNKKIEKFINSTKIFPDFKDIRSLIDDVNEKNKLSMNKNQLDAEAEKIFKKLGSKLKSRRMADEDDVMNSYISHNNGIFSDPADKDSQLEVKLESQFRQGKKNFEKVFEDFSDKQISQKLEPEAVSSDNDESDPKDDHEEEDEEMEKDDFDAEGSMNPVKKVKLMRMASSNEENDNSSDDEVSEEWESSTDYSGSEEK